MKLSQPIASNPSQQRSSASLRHAWRHKDSFRIPSSLLKSVRFRKISALCPRRLSFLSLRDDDIVKNPGTEMLRRHSWSICLMAAMHTELPADCGLSVVWLGQWSGCVTLHGYPGDRITITSSATLDRNGSTTNIYNLQMTRYGYGLLKKSRSFE